MIQTERLLKNSTIRYSNLSELKKDYVDDANDCFFVYAIELISKTGYKVFKIGQSLAIEKRLILLNQNMNQKENMTGEIILTRELNWNVPYRKYRCNEELTHKHFKDKQKVIFYNGDKSRKIHPKIDRLFGSFIGCTEVFEVSAPEIIDFFNMISVQ